MVLAALRRRQRKWLKPEDMTKEAVGKTFKKVCVKLGQGPNLEKARQGSAMLRELLILAARAAPRPTNPFFWVRP